MCGYDMATEKLKQQRYRLFVDESGDHSYKKLDNPAHRYLSLLGVWFRQADEYLLFADQMQLLSGRFLAQPKAHSSSCTGQTSSAVKGLLESSKIRRLKPNSTRGCFALSDMASTG